MKINLWYSSHTKQWRWSLCDDKPIMTQHCGGRDDLRDAMDDIATTVEFIIENEKGS